MVYLNATQGVVFFHVDVVDELLKVARGNALDASRHIIGMMLSDVRFDLVFGGKNVIANGVTKTGAVSATKALFNPEPFETLGEFQSPNSDKVGCSICVIAKKGRASLILISVLENFANLVDNHLIGEGLTLASEGPFGINVEVSHVGQRVLVCDYHTTIGVGTNKHWRLRQPNIDNEVKS